MSVFSRRNSEFISLILYYMTTAIRPVYAYASVAFALAIAVVATIGVSAVAHAQSANRTPIANQLDVGSSGSDVTRLQTFLATNAIVYPQGIVSGYYGPLTRAAVVQFQIGYGLPAVGRVGPLTLAKINSLIAAGNTPDVSAPSMRNLRVTTTSTNATMTWTTNESAAGKVHYDGTPITMLETSIAKTEPVTSGTPITEQNYTETHAITISGLTPNKTYYYSLASVDVPGNVSVTLPTSFTTIQ